MQVLIHELLAFRKEILEDVFHDELVINICRNYNAKIGRINEKEVRAGDTSMQYMYRVLGDEASPQDAGVSIKSTKHMFVLFSS